MQVCSPALSPIVVVYVFRQVWAPGDVRCQQPVDRCLAQTLPMGADLIRKMQDRRGPYFRE
jgi:hypothetical protein